MSKDVESKLTVLKHQLNDGDYRVNATQVADALLRRPGVIGLLELRAAKADARSRSARRAAPRIAL
jgi:hypothetical protein